MLRPSRLSQKAVCNVLAFIPHTSVLPVWHSLFNMCLQLKLLYLYQGYSSGSSNNLKSVKKMQPRKIQTWNTHTHTVFHTKLGTPKHVAHVANVVPWAISSPQSLNRCLNCNHYLLPSFTRLSSMYHILWFS